MPTGLAQLAAQPMGASGAPLVHFPLWNTLGLCSGYPLYPERLPPPALCTFQAILPEGTLASPPPLQSHLLTRHFAFSVMLMLPLRREPHGSGYLLALFIASQWLTNAWHMLGTQLKNQLNFYRKTIFYSFILYLFILNHRDLVHVTTGP